MEGLRIEAAYSVTDIKPVIRIRYETGNIGACKTWHVSPHDSTKGGGNKGGVYYSEYVPQID